MTDRSKARQRLVSDIRNGEFHEIRSEYAKNLGRKPSMDEMAEYAQTDERLSNLMARVIAANYRQQINGGIS